MFLSTPSSSEASSALYARDIADGGYVSNLARLWAWRPDVFDAFVSLRTLLTEKATLSLRERAILVCATAANVGDSYCALAWGTRLASETDPTTAAEVLQRKEASALTARERALATWAGQVVRQPNAITAEDVDVLRRAGITDEETFNATLFVAFRLAFSTVNDALGARPDGPLAAGAPATVRDAINYGRSVSDSSAE
jgi:uncharacterized peroxidase-related enzyme